MKSLYFVRHCQAAGQERDAPLTEQGRADAGRLVPFFREKEIAGVYSSPFVRAIETIRPYAEAAGRRIVTDERLVERVLSSSYMEDWMTQLEATYHHLDLRFPGGESSREATDRAMQFISWLCGQPGSNFVVVTHGALLSLILMHVDPSMGFHTWRGMGNPDVYILRLQEGQAQVQHCWE